MLEQNVACNSQSLNGYLTSGQPTSPVPTQRCLKDKIFFAILCNRDLQLRGGRMRRGDGSDEGAGKGNLKVCFGQNFHRHSGTKFQGWVLSYSQDPRLSQRVPYKCEYDFCVFVCVLNRTNHVY